MINTSLRNVINNGRDQDSSPQTLRPVFFHLAERCLSWLSPQISAHLHTSTFLRLTTNSLVKRNYRKAVNIIQSFYSLRHLRVSLSIHYLLILNSLFPVLNKTRPYSHSQNATTKTVNTVILFINLTSDPFLLCQFKITYHI